MASTFVSYDFAANRSSGTLDGLTLGAGVRYVGGSDGTTTYLFVDGQNVFTAFTTDSFTLVDAMASYDLGRVHSSLTGAQLAVNVANLFDERHVTACPFNNSCYFGAARTIVGALTYQW